MANLITVKCVECPLDSGAYIAVKDCMKCPYFLKQNHVSVDCGYTFKKLEVEESTDKEYETKW